MEPPTLLQAAVSLPFLFMFFCVVGVDPKARATYYVGSPWRAPHYSRVEPDRTFSLFGVTPLIYAILLLVAEQLNADYCSMAPDKPFSIQTAFAVFTIFMIGKILIGPILEVRKSVKLIGEARFSRPLSFVIFDMIISIPMNLLIVSVFKTIYVGLFTLAIWMLIYIGIVSTDSSFIPFAAIMAWTLVSLGRISGLMLTFHVPHLIMTVIYLGSIVMLAFVWSHAEMLLRTCGVQVGLLPSYGGLFRALIR